MSARGFLAAVCAAAALLSARAAEAAATYTGQIATQAGCASGPTVCTITATANVAANGTNLVVIGEYQGNATATASVASDSAGNTYTCAPVALAASGSANGRVCWSLITHAIVSGTTTFSANFSSGAGAKIVNTAAFAGVTSATADASATPATGTGTAATVTGTASGSGELGLGYWASPTNTVTSTGSSFTTVVNGVDSGTFQWAYNLSVGPGSVTYAPTLSSSVVWAIGVVSLPTAAGVAGRTGTSMSLTGVGHE